MAEPLNAGRFWRHWRTNGIFKATVLIVIGTVVSAWIIFLLEHPVNREFTSFWDGVWWVLVTISTVGYGDLVPQTPGGRIVAVFMMLFGIALLSVITATVASVFVTQKLKEGKGLQAIKLKDHLLFCGWNGRSEEILTILARQPKDFSGVVLINQLPEETVVELLARFASLHLKFVRGDFTKENVLNRAGVAKAKTALVVPDESASVLQKSDERTILATLSLKTLNPKIRVIAHVIERDNVAHLNKAKADEIILSDAFTSQLMAHHVVAPGIPQFLEQLLGQTGDTRLNRYPIPAKLIGQTYAQLQAFVREQNPQNVLLGLGETREAFDLNNLLGSDYSYLDEFIMRKFREAGRNVNEKRVAVQLAPSADTVLTKNHFYLILEKIHHEKG